MASAKEPREDSIVDIGSMTGLHREDAIKWLKAYDNNANKAMDAFFENPTAIHDQQSQVNLDEQQRQKGWEENRFHTDNPNGHKDSQTAFGVHASNSLRPSVLNDGAPSRPPSRVSGRAFTTIDGGNKKCTVETEDEQVQRAMAMSMADSRTLSDQEIGVLENKGFGPATREHYETEKWALTVTGPQTQEIVLDPDPLDRIRSKGAPAFLKPSPAGHRLPALLKILHSIPMAREALLNRAHTLSDYGGQKEWWAGTAVQPMGVSALRPEESDVNSDIIYEVQRIMGFLDITNRAYGSTDVLEKLESMGSAHNDKIRDFYAVWHNATVSFVPDAPKAEMFQSVGRKVSTENPQSERFYSLFARVDDEISGKILTLYDLLDHMLWSDNQDDEQTFLEKVGDVFTLEVCNQVVGIPGLGIEIPATWYADRYLPSSTKQVKDMILHKAQICKEMEAHEKAQTQLRQYPNSLTGPNFQAAELLMKATKYFGETVEHHGVIKTYPRASLHFKNAAPSWEGLNKIAQELNILSDSISSRIQALEEARYMGLDRLKNISRMYTKPSANKEQPPHRRYMLRGVSTTPYVTYVLERTEPDRENEMLTTKVDEWQWWKLEFVTNDPKPVVVAQVTEEFVLHAASTESQTVLLVYASEDAIAYDSHELPPQLHDFVQADNRHFNEELNEIACPQPRSPTKRKACHDASGDARHNHQQSNSGDQSIIEAPIVDPNLNPDLPHPISGASPPQTYSDQRAYSAEPSDVKGFDDVIPTSLQSSGFTIEHQDSPGRRGKSVGGQEMEERGEGGRGLLRHHGGRRDKDVSGRSVPELEMDDD